jgi:adenylyltransferase and sulfurtransferase
VPDHSTTTNLTSETPDTSSILIPPPPLASSRYNRQLLLPQISLVGQERILSSRVLIIGLGGLGSPAALYLAGAGVGTLGFVDGDVVEKSNLHRQIVHREDSVADPSRERSGMSKVHSAIQGCRELNSEINYIAHEERLSVSNALGIIEQYDLVLDCTDNPATRYLISDACIVAGKTLISGAAQRLEGQLVVLNYPMEPSKEASIATDSDSTSIPAQNGLSARNAERTNAKHSKNPQHKTKIDRGPCYRCIFPHPPSPEMVQTCSEIGILGPVVGCIGTLMASEALRLIVQGAHLSQLSDVKEGKKFSMLLFSAWPSDPKAMFRTITLAGRRKGCVSCGEEEVVRKLGKTKITREALEQGGLDYQAWCGVLEDVRLLERDRRVGAREFLNVIAQDDGRGEEMRAVGKVVGSEDSRERGEGVAIDVREENEWILGAKVKGSINIPISKILRDPATAFKALEQLPGDEKHQGTKVGTHQTSAQEGEVAEEKNNNNNEADEIPEFDQTRTSLMPIYFLCHRGNDSQIAAQKLIELDQQAGRSRGWTGDVEGGFVALERARQAKR